jgi:Zn-dependent protease with chaperone function
LEPVVACGALVAVSVALFARSFVTIALATWRAKRQLAHLRVAYQLPPAVAPGDLEGLVVIEDERSTAFCVGLFRPSVVVSTGLLEHLGEPALRAVVGHELSHLARRDPLRRALARSIARGLFFVPSLSDRPTSYQPRARCPPTRRQSSRWAVSPWPVPSMSS